MSSTSTAYSSTTTKTRQPKQEDVLFSKVLSRIRTSGKPVPIEDTGDIGQWQTVLEEMNAAALENQVEGTLAALLKSYPRLNAILSLPVETDIDQEQAAEQEDKYFKFLDFKDLRNLPKPKWLLYDVLPSKGIGFVYGPKGCGKTYVTTGMAIAVASEELSWLGRVTKHGPVIYLAAEDIDEVAQRFIGAALHYGLTDEDLSNLHIYPCPLSLATDTPKLIESLEHQYPGINPVLFIVDTLAMCSIGIDENSAKEYGQVISSLEMIWRKYNCCVVAVHHCGKNGEMRGTSTMDGVAYSMMLVSEVDENVMLHSVKKRRGKHFEDIYLDREIVELPGELDEMGQPVTTCVLVKSDRTAAADPNKLTKLQQTIVEHLSNLGGTDIARTELMKACMIEKSREQSFTNAISGLLGKGLITKKTEKQRTSYSLISAIE